MKAKFSRIWILLLITALLLLVSAAFAQFNAAIQGTVTDNTGAVIPGATVTATNQATGVVVKAVSTGAGLYRISGLPPGVYTVVTEAANFGTRTDKDVSVAAEQPRGLDVSLAPAGTNASVTVSASTQPELQTENGSISGNITTQQVQNLPQFGGDPYELLRLTPGVFGNGARSTSGGTVNLPNTTGPGGSTQSIFQIENQVNIVANGQRLSSNNYMIDGVDVNSQTWGGAAVVTPNDDSVKEIHVISSQYSAETGRNSGATVQVVTKSGTNRFHGGGFFDYQDPSLNSHNGYGGLDSNGLPINSVKVQNKWREYGGNIGGPVWKDRLFFFASYEGLHSNANTVSTPTYILTPQFMSALAAARPGSFANTIVNAPGLTPRVNQVLTGSCAPFVTAKWPCAVVNGGLDIGSPIGAAGTYAPFFSGPGVQAGGGLDGIPDIEFATLNQPTTLLPNEYNGRIDYNAGRHQFTFSGILTKGEQTAFTLSTAPGQDLKDKPTNAEAMVAWIYAISPTWLNDFRINGTRFAFNELNKSTGIDFGLPYTDVENLPNGVSRINITADRSGNTPSVTAENTYEVRDNVTKILGRHAIKFGGEYRREQNNDNLAGNARPQFTFAGPWNLFNSTPIFEAANANPVTGANANFQKYFRDYDYGIFLQDDVKLSPTLTVNLGIRYEYYDPLTEKNGQLSNFFFGSGGYNTGYLNGALRTVSQFTRPDRNNFAPRLGFAWAPGMFDNKTVFRGGFGVAYNRLYDALLTNSRDNPPFNASYSFCCGTAPTEFGTPFDGGLIVPSISTNGVSGYTLSPLIPSQLPLGPNNLPLPGKGTVGNLYGAPQSFPNPYVYLYSLEIQQQFTGRLVGTIGYQGSQTRKEIRLVDQKYIYSQVNPSIDDLFFATPDVNGDFNALNANLHANYSNWNFAANYRFSKSMDTLSYGGPGAVTNQTYPQNQKYERGPSDYDATNYLNFSTVWQTPWFKGGSGFATRLLADWTVSGIFTYNSGLPWTPVVNNGTCLPVASQCVFTFRPSAVLQAPVYSNSYSALTTLGANFPAGGPAYYDVKTPGVPAIGRNSLRGPDYKSVDLSVGKQFRFTESVG
ncbi:MAG: TonB-dependent receptor, partial [Acidobacteriaceae bacterium]